MTRNEETHLSESFGGRLDIAIFVTSILCYELNNGRNILTCHWTQNTMCAMLSNSSSYSSLVLSYNFFKFSGPFLTRCINKTRFILSIFFREWLKNVGMVVFDCVDEVMVAVSYLIALLLLLLFMVNDVKIIFTGWDRYYYRISSWQDASIEWYHHCG